MRECVKNWEDTTPGTVRGKPAYSRARWLSIPADGSYGLSLHSDARFEPRNTLNTLKDLRREGHFRVLRVFRGSNYNPRLHSPPKYEIIHTIF